MDHPRTCGEKFNTFYAMNENQGSPPHMRGKVSSYSDHFFDIGITPRTCGEKIAIHCFRWYAEGSPPHMRGKVIQFFLLWTFFWITPAHAGKRNFAKGAGAFLEDHPRTCGEKQLNIMILKIQLGSPPHMWRKGSFLVYHCSDSRITPTHVGKRKCDCCRGLIKQDHPHTCGEKAVKSQEAF